MIYRTVLVTTQISWRLCWGSMNGWLPTSWRDQGAIALCIPNAAYAVGSRILSSLEGVAPRVYDDPGQSASEVGEDGERAVVLGYCIRRSATT